MEFGTDMAQQIARHLLVIDQTYRLSFFAILHPAGNLLDQVLSQPTVEFDFGIPCKLEGVSLERIIMESGENKWKTKPHHIIQKHNTGTPLFRRQDNETPKLSCRQLDQSKVPNRATTPDTFSHQFDCQIDSRILQITQPGSLRRNKRIGRTIQICPIDHLDVTDLRRSELRLINQIDILLFEIVFDLLECGFKLLQIGLGQLFDQTQFSQSHGTGLLAMRSLLIFYYPFEGRNPNPIKFIEIVGIDTQKGEPLEQRHIFTLGLLQNAPVEIHPTHIAVQHLYHLFLFHILPFK